MQLNALLKRPRRGGSLCGPHRFRLVWNGRGDEKLRVTPGARWDGNHLRYSDSILVAALYRDLRSGWGDRRCVAGVDPHQTRADAVGCPRVCDDPDPGDRLPRRARRDRVVRPAQCTAARSFPVRPLGSDEESADFATHLICSVTLRSAEFKEESP